jgi:hypothetical protein
MLGGIEEGGRVAALLDRSSNPFWINNRRRVRLQKKPSLETFSGGGMPIHLRVSSLEEVLPSSYHGRRTFYRTRESTAR